MKPRIKKAGNLWRCVNPADKPREPGKIPNAFGYGGTPAVAFENYDLRSKGINPIELCGLVADREQYLILKGTKQQRMNAIRNKYFRNFRNKQ